MRNNHRISIIIPALNEEASIGRVISALPPWVDEVVVVDNGCTDRTAEKAAEAGARVVREPRRGYGSACLKGIASVSSPDIVVFLDGDFSDHPDETGLLVDPIVDGKAELVIGSRTRGRTEKGALTPQALFGNWLSCLLIKWLWGVRFSDLGPFRAVRYSTLRRLRMRDPDYGWTVEMQIKAASMGIPVLEVPVSYRPRIGKSKISGTLKGAMGAGTKILYTLGREFLAAGRTSSRERLVVFTRYPQPGTTKTRLIPVLGPEGAARLQRRMTQLTIRVARQVRDAAGTGLEVRFTMPTRQDDRQDACPTEDACPTQGSCPTAMTAPPVVSACTWACRKSLPRDGKSLDSPTAGMQELLRDWLGRDVDLHEQGEGDLGAKLIRAFTDGFSRGFDRVVVIGSDCPGITARIIRSAFKTLNLKDLVIGPAKDGGYYLIGARGVWPALFEGIPWGSGDVFSTTMQRAAGIPLTVGVLEALQDVDRPEDLSAYERFLHEDQCQVEVSVVIPALNEETRIARALESANQAPGVETIVVDGGSTDSTVEVATRLAGRVLVVPAGRAEQMNAGAKIASGEVLVFLHGDSVLPDAWIEHIREALDNPGVVGGAFEFALDAPVPGGWFVELLVSLRSRLLGMPYGDQAFFVRADAFAKVDGFPNLPIMEDFEFVRRIKRLGALRIVDALVVTSARRWQNLGVLRTTLVNQAVMAGYVLGVSPRVLQRLYSSGFNVRLGAATNDRIGLGRSACGPMAGRDGSTQVRTAGNRCGKTATRSCDEAGSDHDPSRMEKNWKHSSTGSD